MQIAEVSSAYGMSADTLRYYERIGLLPAVHRTSGGIRDYDEVDRGWVGFIKCMRDAGVEIEALIDYVHLYQQGDDTAKARLDILVEQRGKLEERMGIMQETLDRLNYKIDNYGKLLARTDGRSPACGHAAEPDARTRDEPRTGL